MTGFAARKPTAAAGLIALMMAGASQMLVAPSTPMTTNQSTITGPNSRPMLSVPLRWIMNNAIKIAMVAGTMNV